LGGIDFDKRIAELLVDRFLKEQAVDLRQNDNWLNRLIEASEEAKLDLSSVENIEIRIPYLVKVREEYIDLNIELSRKEIEKKCSDLVRQTIEKCSFALQDANIGKKNINQIILVGKLTKMRFIKNSVAEFFGKNPFNAFGNVEAVALGAAVQAGILAGEISNTLILNAYPHSLELKTTTGDKKTIIRRNTVVPYQKSEILTIEEDNLTIINSEIKQGENELINDNETISEIKLSNIFPTKKGITQIQVTFKINTDGILNISAKNIAADSEIKASLENRGIFMSLIPGKVYPYGRWPSEKYIKEESCVLQSVKASSRWLSEGLNFSNNGQYKEAIDCFDEALKIDRDSACAWWNKGEAFRALGQYNKAIECFDEALRINPEYAGYDEGGGKRKS